MTPWKTPRKSIGEWDYRTRIIPLLSSMKPGHRLSMECEVGYLRGLRVFWGNRNVQKVNIKLTPLQPPPNVQYIVKQQF
jgi:hypothetical protein